MDDISIPLVVGVIRDVVDKITSKDSLVIDVVFNPIIMNLIKNNKNFKTQISELALEWVIKETGLKCDLKWEYCNNGYEYQYGRGDNKDIPVLFFVALNEKGEPISSDQCSSSSSSSSSSSRGYSSSSSSGSRGSNRDVLSSPSSLLGEITKERSSTSTVDDDTTINIDILKPLKSTTKASTNITASTKSSLSSCSTTGTTVVESKNKVLIEEVGVSQQQINDAINDTATQSSPLVPQSTTTTTTSTTTLSSIQPQSLSSTTLPIPPQSSSVSPLSASSSSLPQPTTATVKPPSKMEFAHMEQLLGRFDEDYTTPSVIGNDFGQSTLLVFVLCTL